MQPGNNHRANREGPLDLNTPQPQVERSFCNSPCSSGHYGVPPRRAAHCLQACGVQLSFVGRGEPGGEGFYCWDSSLPFFWQGSQGTARHVQVWQGTAWLGSAWQGSQGRASHGSACCGSAWPGSAWQSGHGMAKRGSAGLGIAGRGRQGTARICSVGHSAARHGRHGGAGQVLARHGPAGIGKAVKVLTHFGG
jgi:hypothetical protein